MAERSKPTNLPAWKQRFLASSIFGATVANLAPRRGLVTTNRDGILQLYAWEVSSGELRQLTDRPTGVYYGLLSADGEFVYYLQDDGGNEIGHYVRVPFAGGDPEDITPDLPPYSSFFISQSFSGNLLGSRLASPQGQVLYVFAPGESPRPLYECKDFFVGSTLSYAGEIAVVATTEGTGSSDLRLIAFDVASGERMHELWDGVGTSHSLGEFSPLPGDAWMLTSTSVSGYPRPFLWHPGTGERRSLAIDAIPGEVSAVNWSLDGKQILLSQHFQARRQLYLYSLETDTARKLRHPPGVLGGYQGKAVFTEEDELLITWQDPAHPSRLIALDPSTGAARRTVLAAGEVPPGKSWKSISFTSEDGSAIHGWLAKPDGEGPFPTILHTHGGPTAVMTEYYSPDSQAWLDHGFAFLTINYHGSTTFGKEFEKSIIGQMGILEVQDMAAAYAWLVQEQIAQPDAVFLTGQSYGGYLTLLALGMRPELWAGGMAEVAIADWTTMYEDQSEAMRAVQRMFFGGTPEEQPEAHEISSPITYAEQVQAPILVIQGSNDTRCPARQMQGYEAKLRSLGKQIQVHWFEAGHGAMAQAKQIEHQELMFQFAQRILSANG